MTKKDLKATMARLYETKLSTAACFGDADDSYEKAYEAIATLVHIGLLDKSYLDTIYNLDKKLSGWE